jgi:hypothetical protein
MQVNGGTEGMSSSNQKGAEQKLPMSRAEAANEMMQLTCSQFSSILNGASILAYRQAIESKAK